MSASKSPPNTPMNGNEGEIKPKKKPESTSSDEQQKRLNEVHIQEKEARLKLIQAKAEADALMYRAKAEAEVGRLKAEAENDVTRTTAKTTAELEKTANETAVGKALAEAAIKLEEVNFQRQASQAAVANSKDKTAIMLEEWKQQKLIIPIILLTQWTLQPFIWLVSIFKEAKPGQVKRAVKYSLLLYSLILMTASVISNPFNSSSKAYLWAAQMIFKLSEPSTPASPQQQPPILRANPIR
ncbi:MAG: hypothetical protein V4672_20795 [Verrucomicrobiota bacterium]